MSDFCDNSSWGEQFLKTPVVSWIRIPWIVNVDENGKGGALRLRIASEYSANAGGYLPPSRRSHHRTEICVILWLSLLDHNRDGALAGRQIDIRPTDSYPGRARTRDQSYTATYHGRSDFNSGRI
jgi:hypothetical protein